MLIETTADKRTAMARRDSEARFQTVPRTSGNDQGEIRECPGPGSDTTAEPDAAKALRATKGRYRTLFVSIDQGFCTI